PTRPRSSPTTSTPRFAAPSRTSPTSRSPPRCPNPCPNRPRNRTGPTSLLRRDLLDRRADRLFTGVEDAHPVAGLALVLVELAEVLALLLGLRGPLRIVLEQVGQHLLVLADQPD